MKKLRASPLWETLVNPRQPLLLFVRLDFFIYSTFAASCLFALTLQYTQKRYRGSIRYAYGMTLVVLVRRRSRRPRWESICKQWWLGSFLKSYCKTGLAGTFANRTERSEVCKTVWRCSAFSQICIDTLKIVIEVLEEVLSNTTEACEIPVDKATKKLNDNWVSLSAVTKY